MPTTSQTKRAPRCSPAHGRCPDCRTPLGNWGIATERWKTARVLANEIGCPVCLRVVYVDHYPACICADCQAGQPQRHDENP